MYYYITSGITAWPQLLSAQLFQVLFLCNLLLAAIHRTKPIRGLQHVMESVRQPDWYQQKTSKMVCGELGPAVMTRQFWSLIVLNSDSWKFLSELVHEAQLIVTGLKCSIKMEMVVTGRSTRPFSCGSMISDKEFPGDICKF